MKKCNIKNLTIWVGAGVSMNNPSLLPSGNDLTKFVLDTMILNSSKLLEVWNQINAYEESYIMVNTYPRLELILSSIAYIEKYFHAGTFLKGFESFNEVPFNRNHMLLAVLAHEGATIMTANFDSQIERAYCYLYEKHEIWEHVSWNDCSASVSDGKGEVIHFHGTCLDTQKMGATIENITHFINKELYDKVNRCFAKGKINIFLGYSFSDIYDVNMTIEELYSRNRMNTTQNNWVCNHNGKDVKIVSKAERTFGKSNVKIVSANTTSVLEELCRVFGFFTYQNVLENNMGSPDWSTVFLEKIEISEEFKVLSTIHLLNRMAIAVDKIGIDILDKYKKINSDSNKKVILEYYLSLNSLYWYKQYGDTRLDAYHKKQYEERIRSFKYEVNIEDALSNNETNETIMKLRKKRYVMYEDFSVLSRLMKVIERALTKNIKLNDLDAPKKLLAEFSAFPVGKFIEIILYASLERYKMLLESVDGGEIESHFNIANSIYYDVGNMDGIIASQIDRQISKYHSSELDEWEKVFNSREWGELKSLCDIAGTYRFKSVLEYIENEKEKH